MNTGRQKELDVARGLAVFFMVLVHVQMLLAMEHVPATRIGQAVDFFGSIPAAPVFMFLLGIGINYSRKAEPRLLIRRGLGLLAMGYGLNTIRAIFPYLIRLWTTQWEGYLTLAVQNLIYVDILQFAGLALIMFGLLKMTRHCYGLAALFAIIGPLLNFIVPQMQTSTTVASAITGLLWGSSPTSYFPFLTWSFYPLTGFLFGARLLHCRDKKRFYTITLPVAVLVAISLAAFAVVRELDIGLSSEYSYYHHTLLANLFFTAFVVGWISLWYFLTPWIPARISHVLLRWSKNVTAIYFIHWIVISLVLLGIAFNALGTWSSMGAALLIMASSDALARIFYKLRSKRTMSAHSESAAQCGGQHGQNGGPASGASLRELPCNFNADS